MFSMTEVKLLEAALFNCKFLLRSLVKIKGAVSQGFCCLRSILC